MGSGFLPSVIKLQTDPADHFTVTLDKLNIVVNIDDLSEGETVVAGFYHHHVAHSGAIIEQCVVVLNVLMIVLCYQQLVEHKLQEEHLVIEA